MYTVCFIYTLMMTQLKQTQPCLVEKQIKSWMRVQGHEWEKGVGEILFCTRQMGDQIDWWGNNSKECTWVLTWKLSRILLTWKTRYWLHSWQCQGIMEDLKLGGDMTISSHWSITNVKKCSRQTGLSCSVLCLVETNMLCFKRWVLFLCTTLFEHGLKNQNYAIFN